MKTIYATKANVPIGQSTKRQMPDALLSRRPHTHNAIEQAELFCNLVAWAGKGE